MGSRGRQPVEDTARDKLIAFRVTAELHASIASAAGEDSVSNWLRDRAIEALGDDPVDRSELEQLRREVRELREWRERMIERVEDLAKLMGR